MKDAYDRPDHRRRRQLQAALLVHLVILHPAELDLEQLVDELSLDGAADPGREAIERAVEDLGAVALVRRDGPLVLPTAAALRAYELWEC